MPMNRLKATSYSPLRPKAVISVVARVGRVVKLPRIPAAPPLRRNPRPRQPVYDCDVTDTLGKPAPLCVLRLPAGDAQQSLVQPLIIPSKLIWDKFAIHQITIGDTQASCQEYRPTFLLGDSEFMTILDSHVRPFWEPFTQLHVCILHAPPPAYSLCPPCIKR
ncbi:hypothetical protein GQ44DRAFT_730957 [Phaeosphaeriaceae sp. PMI808]|nr:hypothetical protein GQ44DRAFT_730957 [Phaeosphaeriaceae sp. PMI808]